MSSRATDGHIGTGVAYDAQVLHGPTFTLRDILFALRRNWSFPILGSLLCLVLALPYILTLPSFYQSNATILVDRSINRYLQSNKIITEPVLEYAELASQIHVMSSESIVLPVIRLLNLAADKEFVGDPDADGANSRPLEGRQAIPRLEE